MSDLDPQTIWDALHLETPFMRPAEVVGAKLYSTAHPDDGRMPPPDEDITSAQYVLYDNSRQHWYVRIRLPISGRHFHVKTGFYTQAEAIAYRDRFQRSA